ncbi:hypothetical protein Rsub_06762 [Raphidocelis subcapitata]|uniref:DUF1349 domain-containing protein n=1 Tax=Raphidocelis subcapitata TaxID=307507 RepID=A0A2V0P254_9CHLO|nr:hypothetical protein Rsub_06762 [Raphidocelis subcapitata]|eukprot:GBF93659.1 hypothetical protein Rsub_06762 [Raphidocelis subcapitata]
MDGSLKAIQGTAAAAPPPAAAAPTRVPPGAELDLLAGDGGGQAPPMEWRCPPVAASRASGGALVVRTAPSTDYWARTHYGFIADSGHYYSALLDGDFVLTADVEARPNAQYDQAGIMVRLSPSCWLKASVEFEPSGASRLGAVVTNAGYSDWSTVNVPASLKRLLLRVRREGSDYTVEAALPGEAASGGAAAPAEAAASAGAPAGGAAGAAVAGAPLPLPLPPGGGWMQLRMAHLLEDTAPTGGGGGDSSGAGGAAWASPVRAGVYACSPRGQGFDAVFHSVRVRGGRAAPGEGRGSD